MKRKEILVLFFILAIAAFFRFWHLGITQFITYDQARDFLIIKRMLVDHKLTLVGPTVLIPGVYLPPFYYYSLAPFLMLFRFHPLGADVYTALLGLGAVFIFYLLCREIFNKLTAALSSLVFAVLPVIVSTTRHAWNPNTTHFFSLLFVFFIFKFIKGKNWGWFYAACAVFGFSLNFHFSLLALTPLVVIVFFFIVRKTKNFFPKLIISLFCLLVFISPLFLFEIRHHFPISTNVLYFLTNSQGSGTGWFWSLGMTLKDIFRMPYLLFAGHLLPGVESVNPSAIVLLAKLPLFKASGYFWENFYQGFSFLIVFLILLMTIISMLAKKIIKEKKGFYLILVWFLLGIGLRLILPSKSFYYYQYNFLFPAVLFLLGNMVYVLSKKRRGLILVVVFISLISIFSFLSLLKLPKSLRSESFFQPAVKIIADDFSSGSPYHYVVAANNVDPQRWDHNALEYRYFLEAYFKFPASNWDVDDYQQAEILYLIDEGDLKEPLKLGGMEMESFAPKKIAKVWQAETGQKIYKMTK